MKGRDLAVTLGLAVATLLLGFPGSATAATVGIGEDGVLRYEAAPGETNSVHVSPDHPTEPGGDAGIIFEENTDGGDAIFETGFGCEPVTGSFYPAAICDDDLANALEVLTDSGNDAVSLASGPAEGDPPIALPVTVRGGDGVDLLRSEPGSASSIEIFGEGDEDNLGGSAALLDGGDGDDTIEGSGATLEGGPGNDDIRDRGGAGVTNTLSGGGGGDLLMDGPGDDVLLGGDDPDQIETNLVASGDAPGSDGDDFIYGGPANDTFIEGPGVDTFFGEEGADRFYETKQAAQTGGDTFDGGAGLDYLRYHLRTKRVVLKLDELRNDGFDLDGDGSSEGTEEGDLDISIERAGTGSGADVIVGNAAKNLLFGGDGNDRINSRDGTTIEDRVDCQGGSNDRVKKDASDRVTGCEARL